MVSYNRKFVIVTLFFGFFLTLTTTNAEENFSSCKRNMRDYCIPHAMYHAIPNAFACVQRAIQYWCLNEMPEGDVKEYYKTFEGKVIYDYKTPKEYCDSYKDAKKHAQCNEQLKEFGDTLESALYRALYVRKFRDFSETGEYIPYETHFAWDYMLAIQLGAHIDPDKPIKDPIKFCNEKYQFVDLES